MYWVNHGFECLAQVLEILHLDAAASFSRSFFVVVPGIREKFHKISTGILIWAAAVFPKSCTMGVKGKRKRRAAALSERGV